MFNYGRQSIDLKDINSVKKALKKDFITQGPSILKFENKIKEKFKSKYCKVVSSGTAALHLIGKALKWSKKDNIILSPITFLATANSILYSGANLDFVDINLNDYSIDLNKLEEKIIKNNKKNKKTNTVIFTDYAGHPSDWKEISYLSKKYNFRTINDNCHALGAKYFNDIGYAAKYADGVIHSYHAVKNFTTGEGGAVLTNNKEIDENIKMNRNHGIVKNIKKKPVWYYEMRELGFNYRITDFQCALGLSQIKKLNNNIKKKQEISNLYNYLFNNDERFILPKVNKDILHAYHLYPLRVNFKKLKISKSDFFDKLKNKGIILQVHYIPIFLHPFYKKKYNFLKSNFKNSMKFYEQEFSIPIYASLEKNKIKYIVNQIKNYLK
tara:strand:- start:1058 stop:2206 length:1149 start_codon:yes stop_codon:yes gene_type:complete